MSLLSPAALAWALLLAPLLALWLLRSRRERRVVPSLLPWRRVLDDLALRSPLRRLPVQLLLLLQLAALAALVVALARPAVLGRMAGERGLALVIDTSASMSVREPGGGTRFEAARREARSLLSQAGAADLVVLVEASRPARVAALPARGPAQAAAALERLEPTDLPGDLAGALDLALAGLADHTEAPVYLLSDGAGESLPPMPEGLRSRVRFRPQGGRPGNAGITGLDARLEDGRLRVLVRVTAAGLDADLLVTLRDEDGSPVDARRIAVPDGATAAAILEGDGTPGPRSITLEDAATGAPRADALALDERCELVLEAPRELRVQFLGDPGPFLRRALAVTPGLHLLPPAPDAADPPDPPDLVIATGALPEPGSPQARAALLLCAPPGPWAGVTPGAEVHLPQVTTWEEEHPLLRFLDLGGLRLARAVPLEGGRPLVRSDAGVLLAEVRAGVRPVWVLGFGPGLDWSNWPHDLSFPIFVSNLADQVRRESGLGEVQVRGVLDPGECDVRVPPGLPAGDALLPPAPPAGPGRRELWILFAAAALALLLAEWYAFQRGW